MRFAFVSLALAAAACRPPGYGKDDDKPDAGELSVDASSEGSGSGSADAAVDSSVPASVCDKDFHIEGYASASSMWLTGNFVNWGGTPAAGAIAFTKDGNGAWGGSYEFLPGTHQYKLVVDGNNWITDPTNPNTVNDNGNINSVYTCTP